MQLFRHYREELYLFMLPTKSDMNCLQDDILKKKNWYFMFGSGICGKHTSRDNKITRTESRCINLKMFLFLQYITYDVCILLDEGPYVSRYSLSYYFSKDFLNSRKSQVVCTLRDRFTDIYPDIQWKRNGHWQCGYISQFYQIKSN